MSSIITLTDAELDAVTGGLLNAGDGGSGGNGGNGGVAVAGNGVALALVFGSGIGAGKQIAVANGGDGGNGGKGGSINISFGSSRHR